MTDTAAPRADDRTTLPQLVMVFLSLYVIVALFIETIIKLPPETTALLQLFDTLICVVFLLDLGVRFAKADDRLEALVEEVRALREEMERHGIAPTRDAGRRIGA